MELQWIIVGTTVLWVLDILYRNVTDRKDAYRYILMLCTVCSVVVLPDKWQMLYVLCRYWYSTFRLGFRIGLLYNAHALMIIAYMCQIDPDSANPVKSVRTWYIVFSCIDVMLLMKSWPRSFKLITWLFFRVVAFGVYALFMSPTTFLKVYFGVLWVSQVLMVRQLL
jgi:hypothetical protein